MPSVGMQGTKSVDVVNGGSSVSSTGPLARRKFSRIRNRSLIGLLTDNHNKRRDRYNPVHENHSTDGNGDLDLM